MPNSKSGAPSAREYHITNRTMVNGKRHRATYNIQQIQKIVDEALYAIVSIVRNGTPHGQPMIHTRDKDEIILHGSMNNHLLKHLADGAEACLNITILDGIRMGKTIPNHSFDFRSVVTYGYAREVVDPKEKLECLKTVFERIANNRWEQLPELDASYLDYTRVLKIAVTESVAKINSGPIEEDGPDNADLWYGVLPISNVIGRPRQGKECTASIDIDNQFAKIG